MITLQDVINEIAKVRDTLNDVEVKGRNNSALLVFAWDKCNDLIGALNQTAEEIQNGSYQKPDDSFQVTEVGEESGESNTGSA